MATALSAFFSDVAIHAPGCSEPAMEQAVRNALIEFCRDTLVWREAQDVETVSAAELPYTVMAPNGANIALVMQVRADDLSLEATTEDSLDADVSAWRTDTGTPTHYLLTDPSTVLLYPVPSAAVSIGVTAAYTPSRTATSVPNFIHQQYAETIAAGALARLFSIPGQAWSQPALAAPWASVFSAGKTHAAADAALSFARPTLRVRVSPI